MLSCLYHSLIEQHSLDQGERICAGWGLIKGNGRDTVISENKDGYQNIGSEEGNPLVLLLYTQNVFPLYMYSLARI